jgi:hypothetical protein
MTCASAISLNYEIINNEYYIYVTLERRKPWSEKFTISFFVNKKIDTVHMLLARLDGYNINVMNKKELEKIYIRTRHNWGSAKFIMHHHENALSSV